MEITTSSGTQKNWKWYLRPLPEGKGNPEWILGGHSDQQVIKARRHALGGSGIGEKTAQENEDELSDEERRDLEQFAEDEELEDALTEIPEEINMDFHRLEREPRSTLYCLVKRSRAYHEQSGKKVRGWTLIGVGAPGTDPDNNPEALHMVLFPSFLQLKVKSVALINF